MRTEDESYLEQLQGYDRTVAECHLNTYGKIYLDEYGMPIDDDEFVELLNQEESHE